MELNKYQNESDKYHKAITYAAPHLNISPLRYPASSTPFHELLVVQTKYKLHPNRFVSLYP